MKTSFRSVEGTHRRGPWPSCLRKYLKIGKNTRGQGKCPHKGPGQPLCVDIGVGAGQNPTTIISWFRGVNLHSSKFYKSNCLNNHFTSQPKSTNLFPDRKQKLQHKSFFFFKTSETGIYVMKLCISYTIPGSLHTSVVRV